MIVLDASVLIAYLDADDSLHEVAEGLLVRELDEDLVTSPLTLAEVLVVPVREGRLDPVLAALQDLEIAELPFPADAAVLLARLRSSTGLKMPDCCVLLTAEQVGARVASFDAQLRQAAQAHGIPALDH